MPKTVLIADDDQFLREPIRLYLQHQGVHVLAAADGKQAIKLLDAHGVDLLLLDLLMPGVDGFAVLEHVRRTRPGLAVVVLTNLGDDLAVERCRRLGALQVLVKSDLSLKDVGEMVGGYLAG